jgi:ABC-type phosphate transport system substrate-binding protein
MFRKNIHLSLAQALSVSAALAAILTAVPSAQAQIPAVSGDTRAVVFPTVPNSNQFVISNTAIQYHAAGSIFPQLVYRRFADYYGIAVPLGSVAGAISTNRGATGIQPLIPTGSPVFDGYQYNYCGTGSGIGRRLYLQSQIVSGVREPSSSFTVSCTYIPSTFSGVQTPSTTVPYSPTGNLAAAFGSFTTSPLLFGASDFQLTSLPAPVFCPGTLPSTATEVEVYKCNTANPAGATLESTRGNAIQIPTVFGGIAVAYNSTSPGSAVFNISTADLCRIFDRTSNGGVGLTNFNQLTAPSTTTAANIPITVQVRSDGSATTSAFTAFLAQACPTALGTPYYLTAAVNSFPSNTNTLGLVYTNGGNVAAIQATPGSLGYVEASFTSLFTAGGPTAARLQNSATPSVFVQPTTNAVRAAISTGITLTADATYPNVLTVNGLLSSPTPVIPTVTSSYPITVPTYALLYSRYPTQREVDSIKSLFLSILSNRQTVPTLSANDSIAQSLGFALPLTNAIRGQLRAIINSITSP